MLGADVRGLAARLYPLLIGGLGLVSLRPWEPPPFGDPAVVATLAGLFALSQIGVVRFRGGATNLSFPMAFAAFHLQGSLAAAWVAGWGTLIATVLRQRPWRAAFINLGFYSLSAWVAGWVVDRILGPQPAPYDLVAGLTRLAMYSQAFFWINITLVDSVIWLRHGLPSPREWWAKMRLQLASLAITTGYAVLFLLNLTSRGEPGPLYLVSAFVPLFGLGFFWETAYRLRRSQERHALLAGMASEFATADTLHAVADRLVDALRQVLPYDYAALCLRSDPPGTDGGDVLEVVAARLPGGIPVPRQVEAARCALLVRVLRSGRALRVDDWRREVGAAPPPEAPDLQSILAVPIVVESRVRGVITVGSRLSHTFHPEDVELLTVLANQFAVAVTTLEVMQQRQRLAITEERNRLAREIHDSLSQTLQTAVLRMQLLATRHGGTAPDLAGELEQLWGLLRRALGEARRAIASLRPLALEGKTLTDVLAGLVRELEETADVQVALSIQGTVRGLEPRQETELYHVVSEALHNVRKHARASRVSLSLVFGERCLRVVVEDDGRGFDVEEAMQRAREERHYGLLGMHERMARIGGRLDVRSSPGAGTRVEAEVDLAETRANPGREA